MSRLSALSPLAPGTRTLDPLACPGHPMALEWMEGGACLRMPLKGTGLTVGTSPDNGVVLKDPYVSAFHCRLFPEASAVVVEDLQSTNGTLVNGVRVDRALTLGEARVQVGRTELRIIELPEVRLAHLGPFLTTSPAMIDILDQLARVAKTDLPVLLLGETGTGKELLARGAHDLSKRAKESYVAFNCAALSEGIVQSELFGHEKGAFTGAVDRHGGLFEQAQRGTLFLDEIGELSLPHQAQLLRVVETGMVRPVGGRKEVRVDVRVVAATHRHLPSMVRKEQFRQDLYHRLCAFPIQIPPLRERPEDIRLLAERFMEPGAVLSPEALGILLAYHWPGNVRELRHVLARASLLAEGEEIRARHIRFEGEGGQQASQPRATGPEDLLAALRAARGNKTLAAEMIGLPRTTFRNRLRGLGLE